MNTQTLEVTDTLDCDISITSPEKLVNEVMKEGEYLSLDDVTPYPDRPGTEYLFTANISQFPRDISECMNEADEYAEMVSSSDDSGRCESEVFILSEVFQPDDHDSIKASSPYRILMTGGVSLPEYCDDESDGHFYGEIAIIYDSDKAVIDKMRDQYRIDAANAVVEALLSDTHTLKDALAQCSYPKLIEVGKVLRAYGQVYATRINDETRGENKEPTNQLLPDAIVSAIVADNSADQTSDISVLPAIQTVLQSLEIPFGDTLYYPGEDPKEMLKEAHEFIAATLANAKIDMELKSVWGIGGAELTEALLVSSALPGNRLVIGAKNIELQFGKTETVKFESETEQIMASVDPSAFLMPLLGDEGAKAVLGVCRQLGLMLEIPKIATQVHVEKLTLCPAG